ncbi:MAG: EpsI family protein [Syntrophaceae bacterium]|nr:EpsI family protein [Syntrophaceae bacterium]
MRLGVILKFALFGALLAGIYHSAYAWLIQRDWRREDYNYGYLIPLVVLYLIWEKKGELAAKEAMPSWAGLIFLIPGILLFWIGDLAGELYSLYLSSWLVAAGILWMHIGWQKLKVIAFAIFIVLTMFPLPNFLNVKLTFGLRLISSQLGVWLLHLFGMSAYREGNIIDLGFTQLQVVDACSGLRYLFPLLVMGILLAYFYRAALWNRIFLVVSTIPLTIVTNSLRIALTGIIHAYWGAEAAEGFFHGFSGWLIFMVTLGVLLGEMKVLNYKEKLFGTGGWGKKTSDVRRQTADGKPKTTDRKLETSAARLQASDLEKKTSRAGRKIFIAEFFKPSQFLVAALLLGLTLGISAGVEFREKIPSSKPFNQFPLAVGAWEGKRQYMEEKFIKELDLTDYVIVDYQNAGRPVNFYLAWYESQRKGESIHSPETCLPGSGWEFRQAGQAQVALEGTGRSIRVTRAMMEKSGSRQLSYFWFPVRGRILTNAWELKFFTFWDSLTRQRTDGALVRLITPVLPGEQAEDAEKRLQEFTRLIVPTLDEFLPK